MRGLIHGIYPGQFLVLEPTPGDHALRFSDSDAYTYVRIVTGVLSVTAADASMEHVVNSHTLFLDKRRLLSYSGPIVQCYLYFVNTLMYAISVITFSSASYTGSEG